MHHACHVTVTSAGQADTTSPGVQMPLVWDIGPRRKLDLGSVPSPGIVWLPGTASWLCAKTAGKGRIDLSLPVENLLPFLWKGERQYKGWQVCGSLLRFCPSSNSVELDKNQCACSRMVTSFIKYSKSVEMLLVYLPGIFTKTTGLSSRHFWSSRHVLP